MGLMDRDHKPYERHWCVPWERSRPNGITCEVEAASRNPYLNPRRWFARYLRVKLAVRLFASLREEVGRETVDLELGNPATVEALLQAFASAYPGARSVGQALVAVNQEIARPETRLGERDEVALLPPVSGG